jgi:hypothetical protein
MKIKLRMRIKFTYENKIYVWENKITYENKNYVWENKITYERIKLRMRE